jgi:5-methylcytosine-specific restriction endonuclease McrA
MDERLRRFVRERAFDHCEYCGLPQTAEPFFAFHIEHIVARQHGGSDEPENNLALACYHCNARKGPNLSALDPESGTLTRLSHPRQDPWRLKCLVNKTLYFA